MIESVNGGVLLSQRLARSRDQRLMKRCRNDNDLPPSTNEAGVNELPLSAHYLCPEPTLEMGRGFCMKYSKRYSQERRELCDISHVTR